VGQEMLVLTESGESGDSAESNRVFGHTENFLPVWIEGNYKPNELVRVRLVANRPDGLVGEVI